ncbi:MAG: patatin-like phospholipase family protein [Putridiphycobacter sp.]
MRKIKDLLSFFPLQLLLAHLRKNQLLLLIWAVLIGIVTKLIGIKFGMPFLFLSPEYLHHVNWLSFFILGISIGGFFMAFHLYSYLILGPTFPFIASLARPFYKFCINNSLLPLIFYFFLVYNIVDVQINDEFSTWGQVVLNVLALSLGITIFILLALMYFFSTNKGGEKISNRLKNENTGVKAIFLKTHSFIQLRISEELRPQYYMSSPFKIKHSRDVSHYDKVILDSVLKQNYFNATFFEIVAILSFVFLGVFQDYSVFIIPAASSVLLFFTLLIMFISFLYSWFRGWTLFIIVFIGFGINYLGDKTDFIEAKNFAYGLSYDKKVSYSLESLRAVQNNPQDIEQDIQKHIAILNKWKQKAIKDQGTSKPKLIFLNVSGGGLRAAMWTFKVLQELDQASNQKFFNNVHFISGASGGMIGAAYYREVFRSKMKNQYVENDSVLLNNVSKDLLNKVSFSLITHDLFIRHKNISFNGKNYPKDRGFFFEQELNRNTNYLMNYTLKDYKLDEKKCNIPLMLFSPTIINDGRRMLIAPISYGFLNGKFVENKPVGPENVEFIKLFKDNHPLEISYLSALRANATFPYILPMVSMPTQPEIALMDAGIRDNFGIKSTMRYIDALKDWIKENTSGVVLVQIRDIVQDFDTQSKPEISIVDKFVKPTLNFYSNFLQAQEFNASEIIELTESNQIPFEVVTFALREAPEDNISLSWHLTTREKEKIKQTIYNKNNQKELKKIIHLFLND